MFFEKHVAAVLDLKLMCKAAAELEDLQSKMLAYDLMGRSYTAIGEYEISLRCHKKQLQLAWQCNDS